MIELDTNGDRLQIIIDAGLQSPVERLGLFWCVDPITKSTVCLEADKVSTKNVRKKLWHSRRAYHFPIWLMFTLYLQWKISLPVNRNVKRVVATQFQERISHAT